MTKIIIQKDEQFLDELNNSVKNNQNLVDWPLFQLNYDMKKALLIKKFDELQALSYLPEMTFLDHQLETAKIVINDMNGRGILADEVGLGKTIEAGLILKELMVRGLVKNVLILVPASLVNQWIKELHEKFYIQAASYRKNYSWNDFPIFVTSIDLAKREPHREKILQNHYDMVIVDEAHKLKNHKTLNYSFVRSLKKKYCLLLTATPIQNKIVELFNLVSILKPGFLGSYDSFIQKFGTKQINKMEDQYLNKLVKKVMVRNRRKDTILDDVKRHVHTIWVDFSEAEKTVYEELNQFLSSIPSTLSKITYLKEICSSREACYLSLQNSTDPFIVENSRSILKKIEQLPHHIKAKELVQLIKMIGNEKVIVFTEYRATQFYLQWYLNEHEITSVAFKGGMKHGRKDWITHLFKSNVQVFIATEAGGEGINLQFCRYLINYDLPWNPMRLEQRIGRIHRYGQENDVTIYNFAIRDTLEEHIMKLLYNKLHLFERIIGKLDKILATIHVSSIDNELKEIVQESNSIGEMNIKINNLISVIEDVENELS